MLISTKYGYSGGPVVVDNIATERSCRAAAAQVSQALRDYEVKDVLCIPVAKVAQ